MSQCEFPGCETKEALPFKCNYCQKLFCTKHRLPENHNCEKLHLGKQQLVKETLQKKQRKDKPLSKKEQRRKKREERRSQSEIAYDASEDYYYTVGQDGQIYSVKSKHKQKDRIFLSMVPDGFTTGFEVLDIVISSVIILFSFGFTSIYMSRIPWLYLAYIAPIILVIYLCIFIPRKLLVKRYGYSSRYLLTRMGFIITLVTIISPIKFIFPGYLVVPDSHLMTRKQQGISNSIGLVINTTLGVVFILLGWLLPDPSVGFIFTIGAFIASQLTVSILIPIRGTLGRTIFKSSWVAWLILLALNLTMLIGCCFMGVLGI
ncbi:MAG: AN1-type zinc finger domain-containing protein [Candidatus Heimdallarchaeota archaeon]